MHARAIGQAGIDHRLHPVKRAPQRANDPLRCPHDVIVVVKGEAGFNQLALYFRKNLVWPVDHDFRAGAIIDQRLNRAEAHQIVKQRITQFVKILTADAIFRLFLRDFVENRL